MFKKPSLQMMCGDGFFGVVQGEILRYVNLGGTEKMNEREQTVDVIIPVYRPGKEFRTLLERLMQQEYPLSRIIIMNTEESFWDPALEQKFPQLEVHHLTKAEFDHGGTRKQAAALSGGEIMVCMTQDAMPANRKLIGNLIKALNRDNVGAAYARQLPKKDCSYLERYTRSFNYPETSGIKTAADTKTSGIKTYFCSNVCAAYRKDIYEKMGGFPEKAIFNEDMILAGKMVQNGYGIAYAADAQVYHSHNYTPLMQFHRNFDLGVSQAQNPEIFQGVSSEGEGKKLVKKTFLHLCKSGRIWLIPALILQSGAKYAGYLCGKNYRKLPQGLIRHFTMNQEYWNS